MSELTTTTNKKQQWHQVIYGIFYTVSDLTADQITQALADYGIAYAAEAVADWQADEIGPKWHQAQTDCEKIAMAAGVLFSKEKAARLQAA